MKKIGILTLPLNNNYGGTLQAFALHQFLKNQNYDVHLIQKEAYRPIWKRIIIRLLETIPFQNLNNYRLASIKNRYHRPFIDKYLPQKTSKSFTTSDLEIIAAEHNFYAVIVGSDQVWRLDYINDGHYSSYFLDFVKSPRTLKISYAASFGKDSWQAEDKREEVKYLLQKFDAVSTREISGIEICKRDFNLDQCTHVLDPTLLVDKHVYDCFLSTPPSPTHKTVLTYILDHSQRKNDLASEVVNNLSEPYKLISIYENNSHNPKYDAAQWVNLFANSDFIVTDSFHGMVFSIIFNKEFVVIGNKERGLARFSSLLRLLGLESRLIVDDGGYNIHDILSTTIDYGIVESIISDLRIRSKSFLESSLLTSE
jgi:hypothetical protein